jgi:hypothetical protein
MKNLRFLLLECPYDIWSEPLAQETFVSMVDMKLRGFRNNYPYGILPLDTIDFVATHLLICEEKKNGKLLPLAGYRSITLDRCMTHKIKFPLVSILENAKADHHLKVIKDILKRHSDNPAAIAYDGSWTILPEIRQDRQLVQQLKDMTMGFGTHFGVYRKLHALVGVGAVKYKADVYFNAWGYQNISKDSQELPSLTLESHFGMESKVFHLTKYSQQAIQFSEQYHSYWENRIELTGNSNHALKIAS